MVALGGHQQGPGQLSVLLSMAFVKANPPLTVLLGLAEICLKVNLEGN